jgi:hypothetical protein
VKEPAVLPAHDGKGIHAVKAKAAAVRRIAGRLPFACLRFITWHVRVLRQEFGYGLYSRRRRGYFNVSWLFLKGVNPLKIHLSNPMYTKVEC